jgi:hypothetical protein
MLFIKRHVTVAAICSLLLGPGASHAATVSPESGTVLINKGTGFLPIGADPELKPGAQVLVQPGAVALISYADTCVVRVGPGVWMVQAVPPCAQGNTLVDFTRRMNQGSGPTQPADTSSTGPLLGVPIEIPLLAGTLVGVSIAVLANKDKGASP